MLVFTVNLLNTHESERSKPNWVPFAWMPVYDPKLAPGRPGTGFESHTARAARLEHQALSYVFANWDERTQDAVDSVLNCAGAALLCENQGFFSPL